MKIALLTRRYPPLIGGAEKVLSYLAPALAAEGADVTVLTSKPTGKAPLADPQPETLTKGTGRLKIVRLATSRVRFLGTWLYMRNLRRWLASNETDLAYVSMLKHDAYVALGEGMRKGFPVVLRPEGAGATGDLAWQAWGRFGKQIAARCLRAEAVVSISRGVTRELIDAGYDPSKVVEIPNGVPVPAVSWHRRVGWRAAPRAIFVGRLAREKGLDVLLNAWPKVLSTFPTARLALVGDGPERLSLDAQIQRLNLTSSVTLAGPSADPTDLLRGSDLFLLPSREEGMSVALLEAMALGLPLVTTSISGNRRLIQDFRHGRLVPPDNPEALARAVIDQWTGFDRAFQMSRAARRRVEHEFSISSVARRHLDLFRTMTATRPCSLNS